MAVENAASKLLLPFHDKMALSRSRAHIHVCIGELHLQTRERAQIQRFQRCIIEIRSTIFQLSTLLLTRKVFFRLSAGCHSEAHLGQDIHPCGRCRR